MVRVVINECPKRISVWFPSVRVLRSPVSGTWKTVAPKCRPHKRTSRWRGWNWYSAVLLRAPPSSGSRNFPCKITAKISLSERLLVICPGIMKLSGDKPASKRQRNRTTETEREGERERENAERERKDNKKPDEMREFTGGVAGRAETAEFQRSSGNFV